MKDLHSYSLNFDSRFTLRSRRSNYTYPIFLIFGKVWKSIMSNHCTISTDHITVSVTWWFTDGEQSDWGRENGV